MLCKFAQYIQTKLLYAYLYLTNLFQTSIVNKIILRNIDYQALYYRLCRCVTSCFVYKCTVLCVFSVGQVRRKPVGRSRGSRTRHVGRTCEHVQSNRWVTALVNRAGKSDVNTILYPRKLLRPDYDKLKKPMTKFQRNAFVDLTAAI